MGASNNSDFIQTGVTTGETTSHLTRLSKNDSQVIGYSHSTKLSKDDSQVAGYAALREKFSCLHIIHMRRCKNLSAP
jgi:hypothetical protein